MQYVAVEFRTTPDRTYAYEWEGETPLRVGQRVVVPGNYRNPNPGFADVKLIYPDRKSVPYRGQLGRIMGVVDEL